MPTRSWEGGVVNTEDGGGNGLLVEFEDLEIF